MGFIKTLFTGKRDELSEEEMKKFKELHPEDDSSYQIEDEDNTNLNDYTYNDSNDNSNNDSNDFKNLESVLTQLESLNQNELVKVKNKIAQLETLDLKKSDADNNVEKEKSQLNESSSNSTPSSQDSTIQYVGADISTNSNNYLVEEETNEKSELDDEYIEFDDSDDIDDSLNKEFDDSDEKSKENLDNSNESEKDEKIDYKELTPQVSQEKKINKIEDLEDEDEVQIFNSQGEENSTKEVDPALFSVVHDELMELFEEGKIILLKQKFTFPTIGERETLAFGVYNSNLSNIKDQTHWFIQKLKQFSRLKECKMLLSEEDQKDLILEVNEDHAVLLSFKTTNKIENSFEFNTKWN